MSDFEYIQKEAHRIEQEILKHVLDRYGMQQSILLFMGLAGVTGRIYVLMSPKARFVGSPTECQKEEVHRLGEKFCQMILNLAFPEIN